MQLNDKFTFGMYKEFTLQYVIEKNRKYIDWCVKNVKDFTISKEADILMSKKVEESYYEPPYDDWMENGIDCPINM